MIRSEYLLGLPYNFRNLCHIYPPLVKEVIESNDYSKYETALTITQQQIEDEFVNESPEMATMTPFQYLMLNSMMSKEFLKVVSDSFKFFIHEDVAILPDLEVVIIGKLEEDIDPEVDLEEPRVINEENFFDFQNEIRLSLGRNKEDPIDEDEDPRIKRIKAKARYRDRIKAKRQSSPTLGTYLTAICCMGIGLNPLNIGEITFASANYLIDMYRQKEGYDIDIRSIMAGAKDVKLKYWIRNLK